MRKKCEELVAKLNLELQKIDDSGLSLIEKMKNSVVITRRCLDTMKNLLVEKGFNSEQEEIEFFRTIKPTVYSNLVYAAERYSYESTRPLRSSELFAYYNTNLDYISRFFHQYEFMYQYYKLGLVELDTMYFLRGSTSLIQGIVLPDLEPEFSTAGDYLFSKFIAMEKLQVLVLSDMNGLGSTSFDVMSKKGKKLKWTGDSSNLIELLYGLFETKQFNHGDVDIADLVEVFEQLFNVNLSNYFQRFAKIKQRKLVSKTKFLDEMVIAVGKRIDDADAFVPSWAK